MNIIRITLLTTALIISISTKASKIATLDESRASFEWTQIEYDFGTIKKDEPVSFSFQFKNSGDRPLLIVSVYGSCGCTVNDYTKGEIPPGQNGSITTTFDAYSLGAFNKTITVNANTGESPVTLRIKGKVVE